MMMTTEITDGGPITKHLTPQQMLDAHDAFMSGGPISTGDKNVSDLVAIAASFAATAYDRAMAVESGTAAMTRAFLQALIDPLHHDLDYLRQDPQSGPSARTMLAARVAK